MFNKVKLDLLRRLYFTFLLILLSSNPLDARIIRISSYARPVELVFSVPENDLSLDVLTKLHKFLDQCPLIYLSDPENCVDCENVFSIKSATATDIDLTLHIEYIIKNAPSQDFTCQIRNTFFAQDISKLGNHILKSLIDYDPTLDANIVFVAKQLSEQELGGGRNLFIINRLGEEIGSLKHKKLNIYNPMPILGTTLIAFSNKEHGNLQLTLFDFKKKLISTIPKFNGAISLNSRAPGELIFVNIEEQDMAAYELETLSFKYSKIMKSKDIITNFQKHGTEVFYWQNNAVYNLSNGKKIPIHTNATGAIFEPNLSYDGKYMLFIEYRDGKKFLILKNMQTLAESIIYKGYDIQSPQWAKNNYEILITVKDKRKQFKYLKVIDIYGNKIFDFKKPFDIEEGRWFYEE